MLFFSCFVMFMYYVVNKNDYFIHCVISYGHGRHTLTQSHNYLHFKKSKLCRDIVIFSLVVYLINVIEKQGFVTWWKRCLKISYPWLKTCSFIMCDRAEQWPLVLFSIKILQSSSPMRDTKSDDRETYSFPPDQSLQAIQHQNFVSNTAFWSNCWGIHQKGRSC